MERIRQIYSVYKQSYDLILWSIRLFFRQSTCSIGKKHKWRQLGSGEGFTLKSTTGTIYDGVMCIRCLEVKSLAEIEEEDILKEREKAFKKLL